VIYRVVMRNTREGSQGFAFFERRVDAEAHARWYTRWSDENEATVEAVPTPKRKEEIVSLLRKWARHPDNG